MRDYILVVIHMDEEKFMQKRKLNDTKIFYRHGRIYAPIFDVDFPIENMTETLSKKLQNPLITDEDTISKYFMGAALTKRLGLRREALPMSEDITYRGKGPFNSALGREKRYIETMSGGRKMYFDK